MRIEFKLGVYECVGFKIEFLFFLSDLTPLGKMPYLLELDASNNKVTSLLDFEPPLNLKSVNLSFNAITEMADLSAHHYLQTLILDSKTGICSILTCMKLPTLHYFSLNLGIFRFVATFRQQNRRNDGSKQLSTSHSPESCSQPTREDPRSRSSAHQVSQSGQCCYQLKERLITHFMVIRGIISPFIFLFLEPQLFKAN